MRETWIIDEIFIYNLTQAIIFYYIYILYEINFDKIVGCALFFHR